MKETDQTFNKNAGKYSSTIDIKWYLGWFSLRGTKYNPFRIFLLIHLNIYIMFHVNDYISLDCNQCSQKMCMM